MWRSLLIIFIAALASVLVACVFGPGHPRTWIYGVVSTPHAVAVSGATISLYSGRTASSANGCFKLQLPSALPLALSVSAPGYKSIEVPAKFGFYRVEVMLEGADSLNPSSVTWIETSESEVGNATCP